MSKLGNQLKTLDLLKGPRVTEKATLLASREAPAYVFEVHSSANKIEIKKAIKEKYKVDPVNVNIVNLPAKKIRRGGKIGTRSRVKKAIVYFKAGDKIDL